MFASVDLPVQPVDHRFVVVADHAVAQDDARRTLRQRRQLVRGIRLRQGHALQPFAVRQLRHQRFRQDRVARADVGQGALRQHANLLNKIGDVVKAIEHQHQRNVGLLQVRQRLREAGARGDVKAVERLVEDQQIGLFHQRLAEQRLARLAG